MKTSAGLHDPPLLQHQDLLAGHDGDESYYFYPWEKVRSMLYTPLYGVTGYHHHYDYSHGNLTCPLLPLQLQFDLVLSDTELCLCQSVRL